MTVTADLKLAYETLKAKKLRYDILFNYYDGNPPMQYVSDRLREVFGNREARFSQNWPAVVIDSEADRIQMNGFSVGEDDELTDTLTGLFEDTELISDVDDVTLATLVTGEAFVFVWQGENNEIEGYYNDPRLCHVFYDQERPREKRMAAKWWVDGNQKRRINLYYPDRIEYYISVNKAENTDNAVGMYALQPAAANPFNEIPIFHFRRERRTIKSALVNVIEPADAINKLTQDMMVAAEFGAFKQRYVITSATITQLKNAPNEIWSLPAADMDGQPTMAGEFSATELNNYLEAMDKLAYNIAIITRTPKHFFMGQGGDPSGEALIAMEAPLNKKAQKTIDRMTPVWRQVAVFMLKLKGVDVDPKTIKPLFERPETVQPKTAAEIREIDVRTGIPLSTSLKREGWTEKEVAEMEDDRKDEAEMKARSETRAFVGNIFSQNGANSNGNGTQPPSSAQPGATGNRVAAVGGRQPQPAR
jgi:SPP1 family phage portal protein